MAKDSDYKRMIHSVRWLRLRKDILTAHPLCERCEGEGLITAATEVHHRTPVEHGLNAAEKQRLMFSPNNLMALCHGCHVSIHTEMGKSGRAATRKRNEYQVKSVIDKFFNDEGETPGGDFFKDPLTR